MLDSIRTTQQVYLDTFYHQELKGKKAETIYLLLHGYSQHGKFIHNKLNDIIPDNSLIISPNGIYPIIEKKESYYKKRFAWYFYDNIEKEYYIYPDTAAKLLGGLLNELNLNSLPVTVIGFSQGGYLAPYIGHYHNCINNVIGIGCVYREMIKKYNLDFKLNSIHGKKDLTVNIERSKELFDSISHLTKGGRYITLENSQHEIDEDVLNAISNLI